MNRALIAIFYSRDDICHQLKDVVMCPQCNVRCEYWKLKESCIYSKITYVFDNYATVVFAFMMTIWGECV